MNGITRQTLERLASETPADAVLALQGWAAWWLTDEAIAEARRSRHPAVAAYLPAGRPTLPRVPGGCWVVCAVAGVFRHLRPAVVLPLVWRKGQPHSVHLPSALRASADEVAAGVGQAGWGLHPAFDGPPLADDLFRTFGSAWASLAGGLLAAAFGLVPKPGIWASAAWDRHAGVIEVAGLTEKMATAAALGATVFAVAVRQQEEAVRWRDETDSRLRIFPIASPLPIAPFTTLSYFLSELTEEPPPAANDEPSFERCRVYYNALPAADERQRRFKRTHLQEEIVRRCREKLIAGGAPSLTHFVTIVTRNPDLQHLLARSTRVSNILLLHTRDSEQAEAARRLRDELGFGTTHPFDNADGMAEQFQEAVERFTAGVPAGCVVIDIKSATAKMKYWLGRTARPGNWVVNVETRFIPDGRIDPGSERPELWRV